MRLSLRFEIFVKVIDHYGDMGVALRLARALVEKGHHCRLWVDEPEALSWMRLDEDIEIVHWNEVPRAVTGDVWIEAFGCSLPLWVEAQWNKHPKSISPAKAWINLEYFSAEAFTAKCHALPCPILEGPAKGHQKWFFYPGLSAQHGGILPRIGPRLESDSGLPHQTMPPLFSKESRPYALMFCYTPRLLPSVARRLSPYFEISVAYGKSTQHWKEKAPSDIPAVFLEPMSQQAFDAHMHHMACNSIRGEDSILTAACCGKPFLWHIYPQSDGAHEAKLMAFLESVQAPPSVIRAHRIWNDLDAPADVNHADWLPVPSEKQWQEWTEFAQSVAQQVKQAPNLVTKLLEFVISE